ncbi:MAG: general secretion pathway protein G [Kiritimatiellia bacterium]|jgi:general secretion pathway protein G
MMKNLDPKVLRAALKRSRARGRRGMNLIEIMIVVAIIVILISVLAVAAFQGWEAFKVSQTKIQMQQLATMVHSEILLVGGKAPSSLKDLDGIKENMMVDGWGREFEYIVPGPQNSPFDIISLGRDGSEGGSGRDKDLLYSEL